MIAYEIQIGDLDAETHFVIKCVSKQHAVELMRLLSKAELLIETPIEGTTQVQVDSTLEPLLIGTSDAGRDSQWGYKRGKNIVIENPEKGFKLISTHAI